jgi:DNA-binding winged helix-turn-helix (wHTH) protein
VGKQHAPGVSEPFMELDRALSCLRRKIRRDAIGDRRLIGTIGRIGYDIPSKTERRHSKISSADTGFWLEGSREQKSASSPSYPSFTSPISDSMTDNHRQSC